MMMRHLNILYFQCHNLLLMKKTLFFSFLFLGLSVLANAQMRYMDIQVTLLSPQHGDTMKIGSMFSISASFKNLGVDTFRVTDSAQFILEFDGSPIYFYSGGNPEPYMLIDNMEIVPGDSMIFGFNFGVDSGWTLGSQELCASFLPFNTVDSLADTIMSNNKSCAVFVIKDSATTTSVYNIAAKNSNMATIYPNPAMGETSIKLYTATPGDAVIQVLDMAGRVVISQQTKGMPAGENNIKLDISKLMPALYMVHIKLDEQLIVRKLQVATP